MKFKKRVKRSGAASCDLSSSADNAGDSVSELNAEMTVEIAIVSANCLKNSPDNPLMNAVGRNTAHSTSAVAMIGPVTSRIACFVASNGDKPSLILRSTFSTTTIASSTTMPMASTSPNNDNVFNPKPN